METKLERIITKPLLETIMPGEKEKPPFYRELKH